MESPALAPGVPPSYDPGNRRRARRPAGSAPESRAARADAALAPPALPRLLTGVPTEGAMSLREHLAVHGEPPPVRSAHDAAWLVEQVREAGLTGRGGAAFPTAAKLHAVLGVARGASTAGVRGRRGGVRASALRAPRRPVVVVNAVETEPASLKDRTLLELVPQLVLDGASLAALSIRARDLIVCVNERARHALATTERAIAERPRQLDPGVRLHVAPVPARYVAGQETALVSYLSGGPAKPSFTPPMPFERGVRGQPTLVSNAETLAHLALIARHGPRWFRQLGTPSQPGSALVTLSGPLASPGVYEIEAGAPLQSLLAAAGGATAPIAAALVGGYAGGWVPAGDLRTIALDDQHLAPFGARLGTGVIALLGAHACPLAETVRLAHFLAAESARQCGPCLHGLPALASSLEHAILGRDKRALARASQLLSIVARRGACAHPDGAASLVASALRVFPRELAHHVRHGPCDGCLRDGSLPLPASATPRTLHARAAPSGIPRVRARRTPAPSRSSRGAT